MSHLKRAPAASLAFWLVWLGAAPLLAQDPAEPSGEAESVEVGAKERRRQAKEARIEEYLRRKEERRAQRELRDKLEATEEAPDAARPPVEQRAALEPESAPRRNRQPQLRAAAKLPRNLARAQENVRDTALARDPTVQTYLAMIDRQEASPSQLAAFGNFLADNGLVTDALEYYDIALDLEPENPLLWLNYGTLHRQAGDQGGAVSAYNRVLSLDPNNAMAHYNIGAILESQGKYKPSIEAYKRALTLDATLGDPAYNPQAVNSERLLAVKLLLYHEQAGSRGLPLERIPTPENGPQELAAAAAGTAAGPDEEEPAPAEQDQQPQQD